MHSFSSKGILPSSGSQFGWAEGTAKWALGVEDSPY